MREGWTIARSGLDKALDLDPHTCGVWENVELLDAHAHRADTNISETHRRDLLSHGLDELDMSVREKPPYPKGYLFITHHVGNIVVKVSIVPYRQVDVDPDALAIRPFVAVNPDAA